MSTTRWACRAEAISAIKSNYNILLKALEQICDSTQFCKYRAKGLGLLSQMKSFNFVFALFTMEPILQIILKVSSALQSPVLDLVSAIELIKNFKSAIVKITNNPEDYEEVHRQTIDMCNKHEITIPEVKKKKSFCEN